jgi:hypothetical protein
MDTHALSVPALRSHWKTHESCGSDDPIDGRKDDEESDCNHPRVSGYRRCLASPTGGIITPQTGSDGLRSVANLMPPWKGYEQTTNIPQLAKPAAEQRQKEYSL